MERISRNNLRPSFGIDPTKLLAILLGCFFMGNSFAGLTQAQKDSGWVEQFNGTNLTGFFTMFGGTKGAADAKGVFSAKDGTIHATGLGGSGYLETERKYSYYRWRVDFKFASVGGSPNAGLMYHIHDEVRWANDKTWPRGIEAQGQKDGVGDMWTIAMVIADTRISTVCKYREGGTAHTFGAGNNTPDRQCKASSLLYVDNQWNTEEVWAWGADSVYHIVNGKIVFKAYNIRWSDKGDTKDMSHPLKDGGVAVQSEGGEISYRNLQIMELDPVSLKPINAKPTKISNNMSQQVDFTVERRGSAIYIDPPSEYSGRVEILNMSGQEILSEEVAGISRILPHHLTNGLYLVRLNFGSRISCKQILIF